MIPAKKKRFVIYTRCSTDDQAQGDFTTLDAQAHHCKNMLDAFGHEMATMGDSGIIKDDGYSGKDLNRPGIQKILNDITSQKSFDGVIFFRLDRLTRNPRDLYAMIDLFRANDVDFVSVRENLDSSTAIGRVVIGILGLLSAFERELTGERVKASAIARVRQGKWIGGFLPYGYKLVKNGVPLSNGRQPHKVEIDEKVAPRLKLIWKMAADNRSLSEIAKELGNQGLKTCGGKEWRKQTLCDIIKNPFYKGYIHYAKETHKGIHAPLIDDELWHEANRVMSAKLPGHRFIPQPKEYNYLLSGLLKCGKCGSHYISISSKGHTGKKFFYYICGRSKQKMGCDMPGFSATIFDQALIDFLKKASNDQRILVEAIGEAILEGQVKAEKIEKLIKEAELRLQTIKADANKLLNLAMGDNALSQGNTFKSKIAELDGKIIILESQISKLYEQKHVAQTSANSPEYLHSNIRFVLKNLDKASPDALRTFMKALIKEVFVFDDHIDLRMLVMRPEEPQMPEICHPTNGKRPISTINQDEALTADARGLSERPKWLPREGSNLGPIG